MFSKQTEGEACSYIWTTTLRSYLKFTCKSKWPVLCGREIVGRLYRHSIAKRKACFPKILDSVIDSLSHWKIELFARNIQVVFFHLYYFYFFFFAFSLFPRYSLSNVPSSSQHFFSLHWFPFPSPVRHPFLSLPLFSYIVIFNLWGPSLIFIIYLISCGFFLGLVFFPTCLVSIICAFLTSRSGLLIPFWTSSTFLFPFDCFHVLFYDLRDSFTTSKNQWFCLYTEIPNLLYLTREKRLKSREDQLCVFLQYHRSLGVFQSSRNCTGFTPWITLATFSYMDATIRD